MGQTNGIIILDAGGNGNTKDGHKSYHASPETRTWGIGNETALILIEKNVGFIRRDAHCDNRDRSLVFCLAGLCVGSVGVKQ